MNFFITTIIVFGIIYTISRILMAKPKQLVVLYVSIWNKPYPNKKTIELITTLLLIIAYVVLLIYFIAFNN